MEIMRIKEEAVEVKLYIEDILLLSHALDFIVLDPHIPKDEQEKAIEAYNKFASLYEVEYTFVDRGK